MFFREEKAQVSFEYLLTIVFSVVIVIAVTLFVFQLKDIAKLSKQKIVEYKKKYFESVFN